MVTVLDHITLASLRARKNRTTLHFALERAHRYIPDPQHIKAIEAAYATNTTLIDDLAHILDLLGRTPGPTQP